MTESARVSFLPEAAATARPPGLVDRGLQAPRMVIGAGSYCGTNERWKIPLRDAVDDEESRLFGSYDGSINRRQQREDGAAAIDQPLVAETTVSGAAPAIFFVQVRVAVCRVGGVKHLVTRPVAGKV